MIERFRRLDVIVGVPLCAIATLVRRVTDRIGRRACADRAAAPRAVALIKLSENGSIVLLSPVIARIRERWPEATCLAVTFDENREVFALVPGFRSVEIVAIDPSSPLAFLRSSWAAIRELRARRVDVVLDLELFSRVTALLAFASGAVRRVGFHRFHLEGLYRGDLFTHRVSYNPYVHTSLSFLGLAEALDADPSELPMLKAPASPEPPAPPSFEVDAAASQRVRRLLRETFGQDVGGGRLVVINPNASERIPIRKWPRERYVELARRLLAVPGQRVVLIGKGEDRRDAEAIHRALGSDRCANLCDRTSLSELLALLDGATALVTNDSGPAHFASLTGTPTVVLFGPETPVLYAPLGERQRPLYANLQCSPCVSALNHRRTACERARCLEAIEVDEVLGALEDLVGAASPLSRVG